MTSQKGKHSYPSPICQSRPLRPRDSPKQPDLPARCRCSRYRKGEHSGLTALIPAPTTGSQSPAQACGILRGEAEQISFILTAPSVRGVITQVTRWEGARLRVITSTLRPQRIFIQEMK